MFFEEGNTFVRPHIHMARKNKFKHKNLHRVPLTLKDLGLFN